MKEELVITWKLNYNFVMIEMSIMNSEDRFLSFLKYFTFERCGGFSGTIVNWKIDPLLGYNNIYSDLTEIDSFKFLTYWRH